MVLSVSPSDRTSFEFQFFFYLPTPVAVNHHLNYYSLEWRYMMTDRSWLGITHTVENMYGSGKGSELNSASIFLHRKFINQTDAGMYLYVKDNANKQITWRLIYQKQ